MSELQRRLVSEVWTEHCMEEENEDKYFIIHNEKNGRVLIYNCCHIKHILLMLACCIQKGKNILHWTAPEPQRTSFVTFPVICTPVVLQIDHRWLQIASWWRRQWSQPCVINFWPSWKLPKKRAKQDQFPLQTTNNFCLYWENEQYQKIMH